MKADPRTERVKRERFMPFRFERAGLRLVPLAVQLDDGPPNEPDEQDRERAEIHLEDDRWQRARLRLAVDFEPSLLDRVLPEGQREPSMVRGLLALHAPLTRLRRAVPFELAAEQPTAVEVELEHHQLAGPLTVTPWLVRASSGRATPAGYASEAGQRLASGAALTLYPYAPRARAGQFLDVKYTSFAEDPVLVRQGHRVYFLDTAGEHPVLWINSDHAEVVDVLEARGQSGAKARAREVFYDVLSMGVWSQLFMHAVDAVSEDGQAQKPWQTGVLTALLPKMFPRERHHAQRVEELLAIRQSDHALGQLAELCDQALQAQLDLAKHMQRLVQDAVQAGKR